MDETLSEVKITQLFFPEVLYSEVLSFEFVGETLKSVIQINGATGNFILYSVCYGFILPFE